MVTEQDGRNYNYLIKVAISRMPAMLRGRVEPNDIVHDAWLKARKSSPEMGEGWFSRAYLVQGVKWIILRRIYEMKREIETFTDLEYADRARSGSSVERRVEVLSELELVLREAEQNPGVALLIMAARGDDLIKLAEEAGTSYEALSARRYHARKHVRKMVA